MKLLETMFSYNRKNGGRIKDLNGNRTSGRDGRNMSKSFLVLMYINKLI
jgi:hypothetical protein